MTDVTRRSFLKGMVSMAAAAAAVTVPKVDTSRRFVLYDAVLRLERDLALEDYDQIMLHNCTIELNGYSVRCGAVSAYTERSVILSNCWFTGGGEAPAVIMI